MIYFVGAGCGDVELMTIKGQRLLKEADFVLYSGAMIPKEMLSWCKEEAIIVDSHLMKYDEIFSLLKKFSDKVCVRLHTGDPSIYSTLSKYIDYVKNEGLEYEVVAGVSACFGASASLGIEYTPKSISDTLIITRLEGKNPTPEELENILNCKNSSMVFYLSIQYIDKLIDKSLQMGYSPDTPCWVVERATMSDERVYKATISTIKERVSHIKGIATIHFGEYLKNQ
jgi:precorrin-4/cobalt-precorrin-4 C11-methyltransferase